MTVSRRDPKERMLDLLDDIRRRINTGEVEGLMVLMVCQDDSTITCYSGDPPGACGVLNAQRMADDAREAFFERNLDLLKDGLQLEVKEPE